MSRRIDETKHAAVAFARAIDDAIDALAKLEELEEDGVPVAYQIQTALDLYSENTSEMIKVFMNELRRAFR